MIFNRFRITVSLLATLLASGCGVLPNHNPNRTAYTPTQPGRWQVNENRYVTDNDSKFRWVIYYGKDAQTTNYTDWTSRTVLAEISADEAKKQLSGMWRLVPQGHFYFYELSTPDTNWVGAGAPATMVGPATSTENALDNSRLVRDILFRGLTDPPIVVATKPIHSTNIVVDKGEQSITFVWQSSS